ncbi:phosphatidylglycerophosphatase and protein-tyrosine phosphatase 1 isoform X3 [Alligator mississippiensis]|uniref:phosphatidylglycerophosphatase and protein-tyrosine phosphatase 1 isoform X3 n=1 Tax=Alligator mississippiensis TaxID=8496 RepID=UPI0009073247|nr:phosphatidylglycerophosphatase and protein-tyrosine phosphatase 1 isoform X3 [Alligator mississippiensis]
MGLELGAGVARLLFYPTLLYTLARERLPLRHRPGFHRIDRTVLLGALPLRARSSRLVQEENVRAVLTLNEDYETRFLCCSAREWEAMGVEQLRLSTVDLTGVPTLENLQKGAQLEPSRSNRSHCKDPSPHPHPPQTGPGLGEISQACDCWDSFTKLDH